MGKIPELNMLIEPTQDPKKFKRGERVRIYLGYVTDGNVTDGNVQIRQGVVLGHKKNRSWSSGSHTGHRGDALELMVEKTGVLRRENPREIVVYHRGGEGGLVDTQA